MGAYHIIFGLDDKPFQRNIENKLVKMGNQVQCVYKYSYISIMDYLAHHSDVTTIIISEYAGMHSYTAQEIATFTDSHDLNVVVALSEDKRGQEYMSVLYSAGITSALFQIGRKHISDDDIINLILHKRSNKDARKYYGISIDGSQKSSLNETELKMCLDALNDPTYGVDVVERFGKIAVRLGPRLTSYLFSKMPDSMIKEMKQYEEFYMIIEKLREAGIDLHIRKPKRKLKSIYDDAPQIESRRDLEEDDTEEDGEEESIDSSQESEDEIFEEVTPILPEDAISEIGGDGNERDMDDDGDFVQEEDAEPISDHEDYLQEQEVDTLYSALDEDASNSFDFQQSQSGKEGEEDEEQPGAFISEEETENKTSPTIPINELFDSPVLFDEDDMTSESDVDDIEESDLATRVTKNDTENESLSDSETEERDMIDDANKSTDYTNDTIDPFGERIDENAGFANPGISGIDETDYTFEQDPYNTSFEEDDFESYSNSETDAAEDEKENKDSKIAVMLGVSAAVLAILIVCGMVVTIGVKKRIKSLNEQAVATMNQDTQMSSDLFSQNTDSSQQEEDLLQNQQNNSGVVADKPSVSINFDELPEEKADEISVTDKKQDLEEVPLEPIRETTKENTNNKNSSQNDTSASTSLKNSDKAKNNSSADTTTVNSSMTKNDGSSNVASGTNGYTANGSATQNSNNGMVTTTYTPSSTQPSQTQGATSYVQTEEMVPGEKVTTVTTSVETKKESYPVTGRKNTFYERDDVDEDELNDINNDTEDKKLDSESNNIQEDKPKTSYRYVVEKKTSSYAGYMPVNGKEIAGLTLLNFIQAQSAGEFKIVDKYGKESIVTADAVSASDISIRSVYLVSEPETGVYCFTQQ